MSLVDGRPSKELIVYKGCFRSTLIKGGIPLKNINARDCFEQCGWTGTVGLYVWYIHELRYIRILDRVIRVLLVAMLILREYIEVWSSSFQSTMCLCDHHLHQLTRLPEADCDIRCTRCDSDTCGGIKGVSVYSCKWSTASNLSRSHWHSESYIRGNDMHNNSIHIKLITWVLRRSQRNISYFLQIIVSKDKSTSGNTFLYWLRKSYTHVEFSHPFNSFSYDEIIITISYFYTV